MNTASKHDSKRGVEIALGRGHAKNLARTILSAVQRRYLWTLRRDMERA